MRFSSTKPDPLLGSGAVVLSTREYAQLAGLSLSSASHRLGRMARAGLVAQITRGVWAKRNHPHFTPAVCVAHLLGSEQGYVSFLSALHRHGMISQIPTRIQAATTGRGRTVVSGVGTFEFFQLHPRMMSGGVEWTETPLPYRLAGPEKALLDTLYLSTRKNRRFASLPELDFEGTGFSRKRFFELVKAQVPKPEIRKAVLERAEVLFRA